MTTIKQISIPEGQLKLRWREPYVTDGTNKALAALDPGAYRGGYARATDPISTSFRITADGEDDNFFLWADKATGTALAVRYGSDVLFDMSARFSGGGGSMPGNETWYVWLDCYYSIGGATTGDFYVGDVVPASANAVQIAKITMPSGATSILDSYIDISTTYRTVAHVDRPALLAKAAAQTVSTNKFQISGKVYYPAGSASLVSPDVYINLSGGSVGKSRAAYIGHDGAAIWVKKVWADSGLSVAIAADSEGFIVDPWVELDMSQTTDTNPFQAYVRYWTRGTLRDFVLDDEIKSDWMPHDHAYYVKTRDKSGSPTSLSRGTVQSQIEDLLTAVNARISAQAPESAPASPVLLWRSHNISSDAAVTGTTVSIYWGSNLGFAVIVGGYISGANAVRATVSPGQQMAMIRLHGNSASGPELLGSAAADGATRAWNVPSDWQLRLSSADVGGLIWQTNVVSVNVLGVITAYLNGVLNLQSQDAYVHGETPEVGGLHKYCRLFESEGTAGKIRLYYFDGGFYISYNAIWNDNPLDVWMPDDDTKPATLIGLRLYGSDPVIAFRKKIDTSAFGGWGIAEWDSTAEWMGLNGAGTHTLAYPQFMGSVEDEVRFTLSAMKVGAATLLVDMVAVSWHGQYRSTPSQTSITKESSYLWSDGSVLLNDLTALGATIIGNSNNTVTTALAYFIGTIKAWH